MIQRKYIGNLDAELVEEYSELVERGTFNRCGCNHNIIFSDNGKHAVKYPRGNDISNNWYFLKKEYFIGIDLTTNNFRVPQMYALSLREEDKKPFLVMEKLNLVPIELLKIGWFKKRKAKKQFNEQMRRVRNLGYSPLDTSLGTNCSWDKRHEGLFFYDFEYWEGPRVNEIMAGRE